MKAIVYHNDGSPADLKCEEIEKPAPGDNQVLIKVRAASVNPLDLYPFVAARVTRIMAWLRKPKDTRLGRDVAGQVEAVGRNVTQFKPGDEVFGVCDGAFAEYACTNEKNLALKPANISFDEAAAVPVAAITALQGLRDKGLIQRGQKVLVYGASGGVGTFAVQIAKAFGAEVTAVCSTKNVDTARSIGADHVIDYTQDDFTRNVQQYDLVMAVNGYHPILQYRHTLNPTGIYVMAGASSEHLYQAMFQAILLGPLISKTGRQKMGFMGIAKINQKDFVLLKELLETEKIVPVIDRRYPLCEAGQALQYLGERHARGKVIITLE